MEWQPFCGYRLHRRVCQELSCGLFLVQRNIKHLHFHWQFRHCTVVAFVMFNMRMGCTVCVHNQRHRNNRKGTLFWFFLMSDSHYGVVIPYSYRLNHTIETACLTACFLSKSMSKTSCLSALELLFEEGSWMKWN